MWCRGVRGAITVENNTKDAIITAAKELLKNMIKVNGIEIDTIACVIFTTTPDLNNEFPAVAARQLGWSGVALLCSREIDVPDSLPMCLRILILFNTNKQADEIIPVYLKGAEVLRNDLVQEKETYNPGRKKN